MTKTITINGVEHQVTVLPSQAEEQASREAFREQFSDHLKEVADFKASQREKPVEWRATDCGDYRTMQIATGHGKCYCDSCIADRERKRVRRFSRNL